MHLVEQAAIVLAQAVEPNDSPLRFPVTHRAFEQPGAVRIEPFEPGYVDFYVAAWRDWNGRGVDDRLKRLRMLSRPRPLGRKADLIAARLTAEQGSCRHETILFGDAAAWS